MDKYRKTIKKRMFFCSIIAGLSAAMCILHQFVFEDYLSSHEAIIAFQEGLLIGFAGFSIIMLIKYRKAMKDSTQLERLNNQEHDERKRLIRQKAGMPMLMITSGIMLFAGILAGYFNDTIFFTLVSAAAVQLTLGVLVKAFYTKKY